MLYETASLRVSSDGRVATLWLDFPGRTPNVLDGERVLEMLCALDAVDSANVETMILRSAKPAGFCAGADLSLISSDDDAREFAKLGQQLTNRIAKAPHITIAFLHGPVQGVGLDLALACDYRLAIATPFTMLGEPGPWGGLTRLTRILGAATAMEVLTASPITAKEALRIGLVDDAFSRRRANIELQTFLDRGPGKPRRWQTPFDGWAARRVVAAYSRSLVERPEIERIVPMAARSEADGLLAEQSAFVGTVHRTAGERELQQDEAHEPHLPVPGTIVALGEIAPYADWLIESLFQGSKLAVVEPESLELQLQLALSRGRVTPLELHEHRARIISIEPDTRADVILLASDSAQAIEIAEETAKPTAPILATVNVEAVDELCTRTRQLVTLNRAGEFAEIVGEHDAASSWLHHLMIPTIEVAGESLLEPLQVAWWDEAVRLVADGLPIHLVDRAARTLGAAAGPLEVLDGLGLETMIAKIPRLKPLLAAGIAGRPATHGFYVLNDDAPAGPNAVAQLVLLEAAAKRAPRRQEPVSEHEAQKLCERRLIARLLITALRRLRRDSRISPVEIDLAIARGLGLLVRHGGLLRYADRVGFETLLDDARTLERIFGRRFKPPRRAETFDEVLLKRSA